MVNIYRKQRGSSVTSEHFAESCEDRCGVWKREKDGCGGERLKTKVFFN